MTLLALVGATTARSADVPTPEGHLGFRPGADYRLADWKTVVAYYRAVDAGSERVVVREIGASTEGRPYLVAFVSSAETIRSLDDYRGYQRRIADPRLLSDPEEARKVLDASKPVVLITCTIHSTETASTLMSLELLHGLATRDDPATREILDRTILMLVPSANPDGVDKVAAWYERSKGHPWEGSGMPELYHKYAGHDTNRDWFMLNLKETQLLTRLLYKEWFPTLSYDVHQMGGRGARLFVPPFYDPINPNLDPRLSQGIFLIGSHMAADLANAGKTGVLTNAMYDNWWNGGMRTTPQRHNIVGVLTEAASVKLATPVFLDRTQLQGASRGFPDHKPAVNFVDPWPGGWWRLRDIVDYELICARSLLTLAARYGPMFQSNYLQMGRDAIARGKSEPPFAWVVPADQRDPGTATEMVRILHDSGIEVHRARSPFAAGGVTYPAGTYILPAAQPYRAHLKDMMERQVYPNRLTATGAAEAPYDVAGWTLPLQMGVHSVTLLEPFAVDSERLETIEPMRGVVAGTENPDHYVLANTANDDFTVASALLAGGVEVQRLSRPLVLDGARLDGALRFQADAKSRKLLDEILPTVSSRAVGVKNGQANLPSQPLRAPRVALYQPWVPSMDEGWTRLVLERFRIPYTTVHNNEVRSGELRGRFDTIVFPSIGAATLRSGYDPAETEPAFVGGLGQDGAAALRRFVEEGGTIVFLDESTEYAIEALDLPFKNVLKGLKTSEFYGPGSILRLQVRTSDPVAVGGPSEISAYFTRSSAFEIIPSHPSHAHATIPIAYARSDVLESGWLLGAEKIQGKGAVAILRPPGQGQVILFGFPPQHRGQPHGTFRLLFNAILGPPPVAG